jgi:hypothetical protein
MTEQEQPAITSGPKEVVEDYLKPCGHKFHKICIEEWLKKGNTCPKCRESAQPSSLTQTTPANVVFKRNQFLKGEEERWDNFDKTNKALRRALTFESPPLVQGSPKPFAGSPLGYIRHRQDKPPPSDETIGGSIKNKYSRRKNRSKKSKISRRYSNKK